MKLLIVYYSTYGNVYQMAQLVAEGAKEVKGVEPIIRTVAELIPAPVIESSPGMRAGREMQKDVLGSRRTTSARQARSLSVRPLASATSPPS